MAGKIYRYLRLFFLLFRINLFVSLEYRFDFLTQIIPLTMYWVGNVIFLQVIVSKGATVVGWSFDQILLLFSVSQLHYYFAWFLYRPSLGRFSEEIINGGFDWIARMPVNTRFLRTFKEQMSDMLIPLLSAIVMFFYAAGNIGFTTSGLLLSSLLFFGAMIIEYNIFFTAVTLSFWIIDADDLPWFIDDLNRFGTYPLEVFSRLFGLLLLFILPVVLLVYVPATAVMGVLDWKLGIALTALVFVTSVVSDKVWQAGLRQYSSASS